MRWTTRSVSFLLVIFLIAAGSAATPAAAGTTALTPFASPTYCPTTSPGQTVDIYTPTPTPPVAAPAVMFIHGGGWEKGNSQLSDSGYFRQVAQSLLAAGFVVASVNYRLGPVNQFPAQIVDVKCALRFLSVYHANYGIDPAHIGLLGSSAGGHLAALAGTADASAGFDCGAFSSERCAGSSAVVAVADLWGANDLTAPGWNPQPTTIIGQVFGEAPGVDSPALSSASPITYLSANDPPFLLVQGDEDPTNLPDVNATFAARLTQAGIPATVINAHGAKHNAHEPNQEPRTADVIAQVTAFLLGSVPGVNTTAAQPGTAGAWPGQHVDPDLRASSCVDATHCWVVGSNGGTPVVLATSDAGAHWTVQTLPNNRGYLHGIDCVDLTHCWAVGWVGFGTDATGIIYATADGGTTWTLQSQTSATAASLFNAISCPDLTHCVAVGDLATVNNTVYAAKAAITSDGGAHWQFDPGVPAAATLTGVSCVDSAHCWVSGLRSVDQDAVTYQGVVLARAAGTWQVQTALPTNTSLTAISCVATANCRAVGSSWNGTTTSAVIIASSGGAWTAETPPAAVSYLDSVSCVTAVLCWATGYAGTGVPASAIAIGRTATGAWQTQLNAGPGTGYLLGVSCGTGNTCTAVGFQARGGASAAHVYTTTNGTTWNPSATTLFSTPLSLTGVDCGNQLSCLAVGNNDDGTVGVLSTTDGGVSWTPQTAPAGVTHLTGITCPATSTCLASGANVFRSNGKLSSQAILAKTVDGGTSWSVRSFAATSITELTGLDCPSTLVCVAAGYLVSTPGAAATAVITSTADGGTTWTPANLATPTAYLGAVSCATTQRCWAVGQTASRSGTVYTSPDGGRNWTAQFTDSGSVRLDGVSCPATQFCVAAGDAPGGAAQILGFDGTTWTAESAPSGSNAGALASVSCIAGGTCTTVGASTSAPAGPVVILKRANGLWTSQPVPNDAPSLRSVTTLANGATVLAGNRIVR